MKTSIFYPKLTPPVFLSTTLIFNRLHFFKWLIVMISLMPLHMTKSQCTDFEFCMSEPFYDETEHLFAIDVMLTNFDLCFASGFLLEINYSNSAFIIDEDRTEASALSEFDLIAVDFTFSSGEIEFSGIQPPLDEGVVITEDLSSVIFTVYFSAAAGECADFYFTETDILVAFPQVPSYSIIAGDIGTSCEPNDVCLDDVTVGGVIESPILDCDDSANGGIVGIPVHMSETNMVDAFNCVPHSDTDGEYTCPLVKGLDYRVTPKNNHNRACGLSSLDIDLIEDYLLCTDNLDYSWQLVAGDVDQNSTLSTQDAVEIQKVLLNMPVTWPSWTFVPSASYITFDPPDCSDPNFVPDYYPYVDLTDINASISDLDFVGIKVGDVNGTCTDCSDPLTDGPDIEVRTSSILAIIHEVSRSRYQFSFEEDQFGIEVLSISILTPVEPNILSTSFEQQENFITHFKDGIFYLSYASHQPDGDIIRAGEPFLTLDLQGQTCIGSVATINEIVKHDRLLQVEFESKPILGTTLYPNPNDGEFVFELRDFREFETGILEIYTSEGKRVQEIRIEQKRNNLKLDLSKGVYLYAYIGNNRLHGKFIVH